MTVGIRTHHYRDRTARSRNWGAWMRRSGYIFGLALLLGGGVWLFCVSSIFAVSDVRVHGATTIGDAAVADAVRALLGQKHLYVLQPRRNIVLLDGGAIADELSGQYAAIASISVTKDYPHALEIAVTERQPMGTWCRPLGEPRPADGAGRVQECQFFDRAGVRWGQALQSSGPLLLLINDERTDDVVDPRMFQGILTAVDGLPPLGFAARGVTLPDDEPGGVRIATTKGYSLYVDALGNVADQLDVLSVFLADKAKDSAFSPTYIDLRTPGRVYYK